MHYVTVFDAADSPFRNLTFVLPGLALVLVGGVLVFRPSWLDRLRFRPSPAKRWFRPFAWFYFLFAIFWTVAAGWAVLSDAIGAKAALRSRNCQTVEGPVQNFHPMPAAGHDTEHFDVQGIAFSYSDYIVTAGFNTTSSHGGPIREGLPVRICHKDGKFYALRSLARTEVVPVFWTGC
jgi:hypothetical protein